MGIPLSTHRISVQRVEAAQDADGYDPNPPAPTTIAANVRAVISPPTGSAKLVGGNRVVIDAQLRSDFVDLQPQDTVADGRGNTWTALVVTQIDAVGFKFTTASLRLVEGAT